MNLWPEWISTASVPPFSTSIFCGFITSSCAKAAVESPIAKSAADTIRPYFMIPILLDDLVPIPTPGAPTVHHPSVKSAKPTKTRRYADTKNPSPRRNRTRGHTAICSVSIARGQDTSLVRRAFRLYGGGTARDLHPASPNGRGVMQNMMNFHQFTFQIIAHLPAPLPSLLCGDVPLTLPSRTPGAGIWS